MTATRTVAEKTLQQMRREIAGDSRLYGERLLIEDEIPGGPGFSDVLVVAADASRFDDAPYRYGLEYIFEGYLLHYGTSRLLRPDSGEFNLLAGDYMYAKGLGYIADLEDLFCIEALADLLRLCSFVHCEGLNPSLALDGWAITTLLLAGRAMTETDSDDSGSPYPQESLCRAVWSGMNDEDDCQAGFAPKLTELLQQVGASGADFDKLLGDINANFLPEA